MLKNMLAFCFSMPKVEDVAALYLYMNVYVCIVLYLYKGEQLSRIAGTVWEWKKYITSQAGPFRDNDMQNCTETSQKT